jgi:hypothetical protein
MNSFYFLIDFLNLVLFVVDEFLLVQHSACLVTGKYRYYNNYILIDTLRFFFLCFIVNKLMRLEKS